MKALDGAQPDLETLEKPPSQRSNLIPGFHNPPPFLLWLRHSWLDILTQLLCLLVAEMIHLFGSPVMPRYFPLYPGVLTSSWGLAHGRPYLPEPIPTWISAMVSFAVPFVVMGAVGIWWDRVFWECDAAVSISTRFSEVFFTHFIPTPACPPAYPIKSIH